MTVDERLDRIESAIEDAQNETAEALAEVMKAMIVLAEAIDELQPLGAVAARESLEAQHQRFKRDS
jgi:hypothetical protein